ncbi:glutathione peroxidase [Arundinibacter roseus]|uniref:Glutathione peroxidase n=1 Tax=Arundinibacter roseus TaxID=2070510 RepID=A0A4R4KIH9_9BACT|nr:glutathione peroxidase [Arundinibacter roseus]TDB67997.1 glutathione peroxidase [Arundinibacter roseus]
MSFLNVSLVFMLTTLLSGLFADKKETATRPANEPAAAGSLYDFKVKSLIGDETIDLARYKGKKVILLNVASKCGYTPQYADWQAFHEKYGKDIVVLGFPANNFGGQEPGSEEEIATFCQKNYGVTFQMFDKVEVVGKLQHPLYKWLSTKELNGWNDKAPTWNFCKYVVNEQGQLTHFFASGVKPSDAEFKKAVGL